MVGTLSKSRKVSDSLGIRKNEENVFDFYSSLQKIIWPVIPEEQEKGPPLANQCPIFILFNHMEPEYPIDISKLISDQPIIEVGRYFDAVSLLSCRYEMNCLVRNNGDQVELKQDVFKGKNLMICCFNVPVFREDYYSTLVQGISNLCSDLFDLNGSTFEMVVVVKMHQLANHKVFFDHFLSGFPSSCLVVPFSSFKCRDYICKYLDLGRMFGKCLILDGSSNVMFSGIPNFISGFGVSAFPFTPKILHDQMSYDMPRWNSHPTSTLEGLLQCDSSFYLDKISTSGVGEKVPISRLKEKVVGLYLMVRGDFLVELNEIYKQCKNKQLEFEIVMVCLRFMDCLDPQASQVKIDRLLMNNNISWCRAPYNNSSSRRLWRLINISARDALIILGPGDTYVDVKGRDVMKFRGISGFPFTREHVIKQELKKLKELTLESLLVYGSRNFVFKHNDKVPVEQLKKRNIFLYFGCLEDLNLFYNVLKWYEMIKEKDSSFELVFIRRAVDFYPENSVEDNDVMKSLMPWLVCPYDPNHSNYVQERLFARIPPYDALVQFGTDGRICSLGADQLIKVHGIDDFPFKDNLRQDVISALRIMHLGFLEDYS